MAGARARTQELEAEQVEKRMAKTKYDMQPVRVLPAALHCLWLVAGKCLQHHRLPSQLEPGDIVKVTYYESLTSKTESTFQGIIIGKFKGKGKPPPPAPPDAAGRGGA